MFRQLVSRYPQAAGQRLKVLGTLFWRQSIRTRILVIALVPSLLTAGLLTMQLLRQTLTATEENARAELLSATRHMAAASQHALISGNADLLWRTAEQERMQENLQFTCIQVTDGSARYCAGIPDLKSLPSIPSAGTVAEIPGAWLAAHPILMPETEVRSGLAADRPDAPPRIIGYAIAAISTESLQDAQRKALLTATSLVIISALLTAFLAWRLSTRLTRRIQHVSRAVDRIASGNLQIRVDANPSTELGVLEDGINRMAESLQAHQDELQVRIIHATADLAAKKEEAERANTAKSRFFASASHDLRQPLHALGLFGEALKQRVSSSELKTLASQISSSISSLETLLNALLDVSRLDAGTIEVRKRHFPASQLFDHIQQQFEGPAAAKGLKLTVRPTNWILYSDPVLLERILINLVSNALRYTQNGRIVVAGRKRGNSLLIQVWDTGIGIPENALKTIFEEFVQLNNPDRDREQGLGLGLAIVSRTVNLLGLRIKVHSRVGRGSVFSLEVPLGSTHQISPAESPSQPVAASLQERLAVVVDDEVPILRAMESLFKTWGVGLVTGRNAEDALDQLRQLGSAPDFLITDYSLADNVNGIEVARRFRDAFGADLPVLVLTGDTAPDTMQRISDAGYKIMHKPVRPARLRAALAHLLDKDPAHGPGWQDSSFRPPSS
jgi:signal transduction histidine kinase/ActR/RegA family two-component response regulator